MILTEKDQEIIRHLGFPKASTLSTGTYYIKLTTKGSAIKELIGEKLSTEIFKLKYPKCYVAVVDNDYYVLSEDLNLEGKFLTASSIFPENFNYSLANIGASLSQEYTGLNSELMDIVKIYIFDILLGNLDRNPENWGLLLKDNTCQIVILDSEKILTKPNAHLELHFNDSPTLNIYDDFSSFLINSKPEMIELFDCYFNILTPDFLANIIDEIIYENNIEDLPCGFIPSASENLKNLYTTHYYKLKEVYEETLERRNL